VTVGYRNTIDNNFPPNLMLFGLQIINDISFLLEHNLIPKKHPFLSCGHEINHSRNLFDKVTLVSAYSWITSLKLLEFRTLHSNPGGRGYGLCLILLNNSMGPISPISYPRNRTGNPTHISISGTDREWIACYES